MDNLNEEGVKYLNTLSPEDRDAIYRKLQKERKPAETLESLTERLAGMNPRQHRAEIREVRAKIDKKMEWEAEKQLALFINDEIEKTIKQGGVVNTNAITKKAKSLDIIGDMAPHINKVMEIRRIIRGDE